MIYIAYEEYNGRAKTSVTSFPFITAAIEELYNRIEYDWALLLKRTCSSWEKKNSFLYMIWWSKGSKENWREPSALNL